MIWNIVTNIEIYKFYLHIWMLLAYWKLTKCKCGPIRQRHVKCLHSNIFLCQQRQELYRCSSFFTRFCIVQQTSLLTFAIGKRRVQQFLEVDSAVIGRESQMQGITVWAASAQYPLQALVARLHSLYFLDKLQSWSQIRETWIYPDSSVVNGKIHSYW